jgi:hypothetical protein
VLAVARVQKGLVVFLVGDVPVSSKHKQQAHS